MSAACNGLGALVPRGLLLDFGAVISVSLFERHRDTEKTLCLPRNPACLLCPVQPQCAAAREGRPEAYPVKTRKLRRTAQSLWLAEVVPPYTSVAFGDDDLQVDLTKRGAKARRGVVVSSSVMERESDFNASWREVRPGTLLVLREGVVVAEIGPPDATSDATPERPATEPMHMLAGPPARPR